MRVNANGSGPSTPRGTRAGWFVAAVLALIAVASGPASAADGPPPGGAYHVPTAWKDKARRLVDPGATAMPAGLVLRDVGVGPRVTARFTGPSRGGAEVGASARLTVALVHPSAATASAVWRGERLALEMVDAQGLSDAQVDAALAALAARLAERETGWGWMVRKVETPESKAADRARDEEADGLVRAAVWGDREAVRAGMERWLAAEGKAIPDLLRVARAGWHAGEVALGRKAGSQAVGRLLDAVARQQASADTEPAVKARLQHALAVALALAGQPTEADRVARETLRDAAAPCEAHRTVRALELTGERAAAEALARAVVRRYPPCDAVRASRVDMARRAGELDTARTRLAEAKRARPEATELRAAEARLAWAEAQALAGTPEAGRSADRLRVGLDRARSALQRSRTPWEVLPTLMGVLAALPNDADRKATWHAAGARAKDDPVKVAMGACACLRVGETPCATEFLLNLAAAWATPGDVYGLLALAAARGGDPRAAEGAFERALDASPWSVATAAAAAALADAQGDTAAATRLWSRYADAAIIDPGPLAPPHASAEPPERPEVASSGATPPLAPLSDKEPPGRDAADPSPVPVGAVGAVVGIVVLVAALSARRRRRERG